MKKPTAELVSFTEDGITLWYWDDQLNSRFSGFYASEKQARVERKAGRLFWNENDQTPTGDEYGAEKESDEDLEVQT